MNRAIIRSICAAALASYLLVPAFAQDTVNLKRVYKTGEVDKYKTVMTINAKNPQDGKDFKFVATILTTDTTELVTADGSATIKTLLDDVTLNVNGREESPGGTGVVITTTLDKSGLVKEQTGASEPGSRLGVILAMTRALVAPDKPLKIGEEIKLDYPAAGTKDGRVKGTLKLVSREPKSDSIPGESLKIETKLDVPLGAAAGGKPVKINSTGFIEQASGKIYKIDGTVMGNLGMLPPGATIAFTVEKLAK
jgi:hypothetical protein